MYKDEMFRDEKFVTINDIRISKNGFKNLSFETSRYSDGIETIRGFGTNLNERNLSIVDTISIDFLIDYTELKEFALVYSMFKAMGALPIANDYILDKIKGTLAYERAVSITRDKNAKTITHLIVLLERMEITSLERTDSGFSVNMILTLYRHGYSSSEFAVYSKKFKKWDNETNFIDNCETAIKEQISKFKTNGNLKLKVYNIEKLNASYKSSALLNEGDGNTYFTEDEKGKKEEEYNIRYQSLRKFEDMKPTVIEVPAINIGQLELITHNNIANLPLYGEPIGIKSYMGIGKTSFIIKMIFDESDSVILKSLKELSDLSIVNHKVNIEIPIVNMFDFHTSTITNIFFNNLEEANGVMVTIKFELNGYDFYKDETNNNSLNLNTTLNLEEVNSYGKTINMATYYFENILDDMCFNKNKNMRKKINNLYSSVIASNTSSKIGEDNVDGGSKGDVVVTYSTLYDYMSIFSSGMSMFFKPTSIMEKVDSFKTDTIEKELYEFKDVEIHADSLYRFKKTPNDEAELIKIKEIFNNSIISDSFSYTNVSVDIGYSTDSGFTGDYSYKDGKFENKESELIFREIQRTNMYKFLDSMGVLSVYGSSELKKEFGKYFSNPVIGNAEFGSASPHSNVQRFLSNFNDKIIYNFINTMYSEKIRPHYGTVFNRYLYMSLIYDIPKIVLTNMDTIIEKINNNYSYLNANDNVRFDKIYEDIRMLLIIIKEQVINRLKNVKFIDEVIRLTSIELSKRIENDPEECTFEKIKETLEEHIERFTYELGLKFETDFEKVLDQVNLIFITKTILGYGNVLASSQGAKNNKIDVNLIIKTNIISSALFGIFLFREKERTDNYGLLFENMTDNIGTKLSEYYFILKKYRNHINEDDKKLEDYEFFKEYYGENTNSEKQKRANTGLWSFTAFDKINTLKKDFLFFYGKKIKDLNVEEILWSFETDKEKEQAFSFMEKFINEKKNIFSKGEIYNEQLEYELNYKKKRGAVLPSYFKNTFHKDGKINSIMRKRIIGNDDPFMNLDKISKMVSYINKDVMPDYDITVYNADYQANGIGPFSKLEFKSSFAMNNVSSIRISKDPTTKIKTAKITIIDLDKKLINKDSSNSSISFKANVNGDIEIYTIEVGDYMKIKLGYGSDKANEFRGEINSIFNAGNYIEITCVGLASSLYSTKIKEIVLGSDKSSKVTGFFHSILKNLNYTNKKINKTIFNSLFMERSCNNHLFSSFDDNKNVSFSQFEESSMYNAAITSLALLGQSVKNKFTQSNVNSSSAFYKEIVEETMKSFGKIGETSPTSTSSNIDFFKNLYNVDRDYEAYGLLQNEIKVTSTDFGVQSEEFVSTSHENVGLEEKKSEPEELQLREEEFIFPCMSERVTSKFGEKRTGRADHGGIDVGPIRKNGNILDEDNKIWASSEGEIIKKYLSESYGNCVIIQHDNKIKTLYAHMKNINTSIYPGKYVKKGEELGTMGNTGRSYGVHLHFEVIINDVKVDPVSFLKSMTKKGVGNG